MAWFLISSLPLLFAIAIATLPGEWLDEQFYSHENRSTFDADYITGGVNYITDSPNGLWSNVLVLPDFKAGDRLKFDAEGKIATGSDALSLRGRNLRGAVFVRGHLDKADFTGAQLREAIFAYAELRQAKFGCDYDGGELKCAQLQGVNLRGAKLQGADLWGAQLQGATLREARLQGAFLSGARLQDADLVDAQLQGADLGLAELQGVALFEAQLQGADLTLAQLQGVDLSFVPLQGADLTLAQLQGANLFYTELQGADLDHALVWRAKAPNKRDQVQDMWGKPDVRAKSRGLECSDDHLEACDCTPASYAALKAEIENAVSPGPRRDATLKQIAVLEKPPEAADDKLAGLWTALVDPNLMSTQYLAALAATLQHEFCAHGGSPVAISGLTARLDYRFSHDREREAELAKAFLDETKCPAAHGLSEETRGLLQQIVNRDANPTPGAGTASR